MKRASCTWRRVRLEPLESRRMLADSFEQIPLGEGVGSEPRDFISAANRVYFTADDGIHGREPWVTDGTPAGTRMLVDHTPGSEGSDPFLLAGTDSHLVYQVPNDGSRGGVFVMDATAGGQILIGGADASTSRRPAASWGQWMAVESGALTITDGSLGGTRQEDRGAWDLTPVGDRLYFLSAFVYWDPWTIWATNGADPAVRVIGDEFRVTELGAVGESLYFLTGNGPSESSAVWRFNDGAIPPTKLADLPPGYWQILDVAGRVVLQGYQGDGPALYRLVGGAPTLLTQLSSPVQHSVVYQGALYYSVTSSELWRTDGTPAGTWRVAELGDASSISAMVAQDEGLALTTYDTDGGYSIWSSRGTAESTQLLRSFNSHWDIVPQLAILGDQVLLPGQDNRGHELWSMEPGSSVHRLLDIRPDFLDDRLMSDGQRHYTVISEGSSQSLALWDPTARKATPLAGGFEQFGTSNYGNAGTWGAQGQLYVQRTRLSNQTTVLWGSRGDATSTVELLQSSRELYGHTLVGSRLYFFVYGEGTIPSELWVSDGTPSGTNPVLVLSEYTKRFSRGDRLFFTATINGVDGIYSHAGPNQAPALWYRSSTGLPDLVGVGDSLAYFVRGQLDPWHLALWVTDGTEVGTRQIGVIPGSNYSPDATFWTLQDRLFYATVEGFWVIDDVQQPVRLMEYSPADRMIFDGNLAYFMVNSQLWATDGTLAGTRLLLDQYVDLSDAALLDHRLYFSAADSNADFQVWRTDATTAGTELLSKFSGLEPFELNGFFAVGERIYFNIFRGDGRSHFQYTPGYGSPRLADLPVTLHGPGQQIASAMVGSGEQLRSTSVGVLSAVSLTFDEQVIVKQSDLSLSGERLGPLAIGGFSYDNDRRTATWRLAQPLESADRITLRLRDTVHDPNGTRLDGEWINPTGLGDAFASEYSGDYVEGGDFVFQFTVLPGDANRDNVADGSDYLIWAERFGSRTAAGAAGGDFDGDGIVLGGDYLLWADTFGSDLRGAAAGPQAGAPAEQAVVSSTVRTFERSREIDWEFLAANATVAEQSSQALRSRAARRDVAKPWRPWAQSADYETL